MLLEICLLPLCHIFLILHVPCMFLCCLHIWKWSYHSQPLWTGFDWKRISVVCGVSAWSLEVCTLRLWPMTSLLPALFEKKQKTSVCAPSRSSQIVPALWENSFLFFVVVTGDQALQLCRVFFFFSSGGPKDFFDRNTRICFRFDFPGSMFLLLELFSWV